MEDAQPCDELDGAHNDIQDTACVQNARDVRAYSNRTELPPARISSMTATAAS
jgi:hypothetical protein